MRCLNTFKSCRVCCRILSSLVEEFEDALLMLLLLLFEVILSVLRDDFTVDDDDDEDVGAGGFLADWLNAEFTDGLNALATDG